MRNSGGLGRFNNGQKNSGIDENFIDRLKSKLNIVDVIGHYITLQKKGKTVMACCPFHMEKTPSFFVNEEEQFYHCFGCGVGGDAIKFVQKYENVDFMRAIEILCKFAGIEMPEVVYNQAILEKKKERETCFQITKLAAKHYNQNLFSTDGVAAYKYLTDRGLSRNTIIKFGLGYSKNYSDIVLFLKKQGFSEAGMVSAGVCQEGKNGSVYDAYSERITFPIIDTYGQVVGFSARTMKKDLNLAKYKNTPASVLFDKSRTLYGINNIKKIKQTEGLTEIFVLEGQMDVIKLYEKGIKNCVACLGTAVTPEHAKLLKRFGEKIVLSLDGDSAGQKATFKSIDMLAAEGLDVRVVKIPNKMDPDEFVSVKGKEAFLALVENATTGMEFKLSCLAEKYNIKDSFERGKFVKEALDLLKPLSDIDREIYIEKLANYAGISVDILRRNLRANSGKQASNKLSTQSREQQNTQENLPSINNAFVTARKFVLAALLHKKPYAVLPDTNYFDLVDPDLKKLLELIKDGKKSGDLYTYFNEEDSPQIFEIVCFNFGNFNDLKNEERFFEDSVKQIKLSTLEKQKDDITEKLKAVLTDEERIKLLTKMKTILDLIKKIKTEEDNG